MESLSEGDAAIETKAGISSGFADASVPQQLVYLKSLIILKTRLSFYSCFSQTADGRHTGVRNIQLNLLYQLTARTSVGAQIRNEQLHGEKTRLT